MLGMCLELLSQRLILVDNWQIRVLVGLRCGRYILEERRGLQVARVSGAGERIACNRFINQIVRCELRENDLRILRSS